MSVPSHVSTSTFNVDDRVSLNVSYWSYQAVPGPFKAFLLCLPWRLTAFFAAYLPDSREPVLAQRMMKGAISNLASVPRTDSIRITVNIDRDEPPIENLIGGDGMTIECRRGMMVVSAFDIINLEVKKI